MVTVESWVVGMAEASRDPQVTTAVREAPRPRASGRIAWLMSPIAAPARVWLFAIALLPLLVLADHWCLIATRLPVLLRISPALVVVNVDGSTLATAINGAPDAVRFISASSTAREYQIDGTDNTNNFSEDAADLAALVPTPEYQFEAWMRDDGAYGTWVDVTISTQGGHAPRQQTSGPAGDQPVVLPRGQNLTIDANLKRPEAPSLIELLRNGQVIATLTLNRNTRLVELVGANAQPESVYFPMQPAPFIAEVIDSLLRVAIWAWMVLAITLTLAVAFEVARRVSRGWSAPNILLQMKGLRRHADIPRDCLVELHAHETKVLREFRAWCSNVTRHTTWADRAAAGTLAGAFGFALFVALAQYQGEPHILDASAYFFQAKIFASGRLSAPVPADLPAFQGPFMVAYQGRWFAQYPPATSALLALGVKIGVPWLIEPLLGVAALGGIYLLGRRMFDGPTAVMAVALGALSPFFIYLAASYLSHTVALCFEVYFLLFVLRFIERYRQRDIVIAGACLGGMFCARELSAAICGMLVSLWLLAWYGRRLWADRRAVVPAVLAGLTALGAGLALYVGYNFAQTGDPLVLPRNLFSTADRYGFGAGIGFYGQHTLAAGMVILDQLLTSLMIDLYGWPFYLTLALIPLALFRRDAARRWDWFNMSLASVLIGAQAGYFYHGIFLGPRYLFESLPFLLLLTARGITGLPDLIVHAGKRIESICQVVSLGPRDEGVSGRSSGDLRVPARLGTGIVVTALIGFNLVFYLPRQITQHADFTGLPSYMQVNAMAIYRTHPHHALVVTDNWQVYNYVVWPLNDPWLSGDTLYAFAPSPGDMSRLRQEFSDRSIYLLHIGAHGAVSFVPLTP